MTKIPHDTARSPRRYRGIGVASCALSLTTACIDPILHLDEGGPQNETDDESDETTTGEATPSSENDDADDESDSDAGEDSDQNDESGTIDCDIPEYADSLIPDWDEATSLPFEVGRLFSTAEGVIACGDGGVALVVPGEDPLVLEHDALAGECAGVDAAGADRFLLAQRSGHVHLVELGTAPALLASAAVSDLGLHDVEVRDSRAFLAAGRDGVLTLDIEDAGLGEVSSLPGSEDARGVTVFEGRLAVADGDMLGDIEDPEVGGPQVKLLDLDGGGSVAEHLGDYGTANSIAVVGNRLIVARRGFGIDIFDADADDLELSHSVNTTGSPLGLVAVNEESLLVAAGSELVMVELGDDESRVVANEDRPRAGDLEGPWYRAAVLSPSRSADTAIVAIGRDLVPVDVKDVQEAPEIRIEAATFTIASGEKSRLIAYYNRGTADLIVHGIEVDAPFEVELSTDLNDERPGCPGQFVIEPDRLVLAELRDEAQDGELHTGTVRILSNDPDEPRFAATVEVGRPPPAAGDAWPDVAMVTNEGILLNREQLAEKVFLAKLYNPS